MTENGSEGDQRPDSRDAKAAWSEAGDRLSVLGSRLKRHYEAQTGSSGGEAREEVKDAARRLGEAVQSAFDAIGTAAKDPGVKDDVRQVGRSVSDALAGTLTGLSGELRRTFGRQDTPAGAGRPSSWPTDDPDRPPPPPAATPPVTPATTSDAPDYGTPPPASEAASEPASEAASEPERGTPEGTPPGASPDNPDNR